jgi:hypothetical protein
MRVDPSALPRFAADLRELWIRAGKPSYRVIRFVRWSVSGRSALSP